MSMPLLSSSMEQKSPVLSRDFLLTAVLVATALSGVTTPLAGHISDRIGRKRMYLIGAVTTGVFAFIYFAMMNTMVPGLIFLAIVLSFIPHDMMYGPQAALIAECFTPRLRYSGSSLGLSPLLGHRRRPSAADRDGAVRGDRIGLCGRALHPVLRYCQHQRYGVPARLHQPRHLARTRRSRGCATGRRVVVRSPSIA